ncbi:DUF2505 domain-containing protein [Parasphingopyxis algicola]|uniref:DUF2505 domain-containing protein n=1 Tax=Parasphingopyxis algicola TaxID=2026624 RepID=UPI0015A013C5|nr:DUF2505 domain-containing protein [Parasphingopyxis algicola]QLC25723.1 DUF2505 domain-containing protein [Parasphingopyxis algicola]
MKSSSHSHDFARSVDAVYAAFTRPDLVRAKLEALGSRDIEIDVTEEDGATVVTIHRTVPVNVSGPLQAAVGDSQKVRQIERWRGAPGGPYTAEVDVEPVGMPAAMRGETVLSANGTGCHCDATMEAHCAIPLMGGKIEKLMISDSDAKIEAEFAWIAEHG